MCESEIKSRGFQLFNLRCNFTLQLARSETLIEGDMALSNNKKILETCTTRANKLQHTLPVQLHQIFVHTSILVGIYAGSLWNVIPKHARTETRLLIVQGETFDFPKPMPVEGPVESWMSAVEREMRNSLRIITKRGVDTYNTCSRPEWIEASLGMVTVVGSAIAWTADTEQAFRSTSEGNVDAMEVCHTLCLHLSLSLSLSLSLFLFLSVFISVLSVCL
jgi:hypothetical protein